MSARSLGLGGAVLAATALAVAAAWPVPALELENAARGRTLRAPLPAGGAFAVTYHHSMYDAPVTEEYVVLDGRIVLEAVSSPSAAAREYSGILGAGERHALSRTMPEIVYRVAAGIPQVLRIGAAARSFLELGDHGDRLVLRPARTPALSRWLMDPLGAAP